MINRIKIIIVLFFAVFYIAEAQTGTWSGSLDVQGTKLSLVFHLDDEKPTMDSPDQGVRGIPMQMLRNESGKIKLTIPSLGASYEGIWLVKQIAGTFTQMNQSWPLTLTPGENKPRRPQTPDGPFPYSSEEVSFANGEVVLNGTLVLPEGYSRETPALVMVTGSGQQNRDEEIFDHKPFAVIADAFARAGIATLRYDDRGFAGYQGNISDCTVDDYKNDALAGIDFLRKQFEKVGVVGHSEGGTIAMMLAAENHVDYIISLAGMIVSGAETLIHQNRLAIAGAGYPDAVVDMYCKLMENAFDAIVNGDGMPRVEDYAIPDPLKKNYHAALTQIRTPYMTDFISVDMRPVLKDISCPVLALNGTKDTQVDFKSNLDALSKGMNHNPQCQVEALDGLNHLFQHCTTGAVAEYRLIEETISPEVLSKMVEWITGLK